MTTLQRIVLRRAMLAGCLAAVVLFGIRPALAGVTGSLHDVSVLGPHPKPLGANGSCSVCHVPHGSQSGYIWRRSLTEEVSFYSQVASPNYRPGSTLLCYDCHDTGASTGSGSADTDPGGIGVWEAGYEPQDIALDGAKVGYYELIDGTVGGGPTDGSPTGGHYWKGEPNDAKAQGDKIACSFCHDVHNRDVGTNMVFFRRTSVDGSGQNLGDGHVASKNTRSGRDLVGNSGRSMCVACHGYSDSGTPKTFLNVNLADVGRRPPTTIAPHSVLDTTTACTNCHAHNKIKASCTDCHGYPPLDKAVGGNYFDKVLRPTTESYDGGAGAHRRHLDALGTAIFDCSICHGPNVGSANWHNNGSGTVAVDQVDVMGQTSWWGSSSPTYVGVNSGVTPVPSGYSFVKKGGGDAVTGKICANLACHGYPGGTSGDAGSLNWGDDMVDDATGAATADIEICAWCHDATPAVLDKDGAGSSYDPVKAPNVMGNGTSWGAEVNGHGLASGSYDADSVGGGGGAAAANKGCVVCHDATYTAGTGPDKAHFDGAYASAEKRLNDAINGLTLSGLTPTNGTVGDAACIACHQNGMGTQVSSHGNHFNGSIETAAFQRECRACHEPHGRSWNGTGRNLHMVGAWVDSTSAGTWGTADAGEEARVDSNATGGAVAITAADAKVVFTANSGENSYDDGFDDAENPPKSVCVVCHLDLVNNHNEVTDVTTLRGSGHNPVGSDCMICHDHDYDNVATSYDAFGPAGGPDMEQFFDAASSATNYNAVSGHALDMSAKTYSVPPDCIGCHQTSGGAGVSNECLKCHYEGYVSGGAWVWAGHANGLHTLELRTAASTDPPYTAACNPGTNCISIPRRSTNVDVDSTADVYTHCLACHDVAAPAAKHQLGAQSPPDIVPGTSTWTGGIGHGFNGANGLSFERTPNNAGPPAYDCGACHSSTLPVADGEEIPSYHASVNLKLVANTTSYATPEYDTTVEKNSWCATRCHRVAGGATKDDKVIDHTWSPVLSEAADQTNCPLTGNPATEICETHPSYCTIVPGTLFQLPPALPYDTGTDRFTCGTCHEPHGNTTVTPAGQMIRMNFSDGTLCDQCHK